MKHRLILASTSSARRQLMDALGLPYEAMAPGVDETLEAGISARAAVAYLSEKKARAVSARAPDAFVLGADQLVEVNGRVLGKPEDRAQAREQLRALCGTTHQLYTSVTLLGPGFEASEVDVARMRVHPLTEAELERYLDLEEWRGCAGGYRIEGQGQALFDGIDGDRTSIQGLPMLVVVRLLRQAGFQFWVRPSAR